MSLTAPPTAPAPEALSPAAGPAAAPRRPRATLWLRVGLAVAVLAASGGARAWQGRRFDSALRGGRQAPFPLAELPLAVGHWSGTAEKLDPAIARATGSTDHTFRSYVDSRTGVRLAVIILYGPSVDVRIHAPDNCYPAQGYGVSEPPADRQVAAGRDRYRFQSAVYAKGEGGQADRQEVYHSWYYNGQWKPDLPMMKEAERIPGMLKVHVARRVAEGEFRAADNPCEDFLAELMPSIQRRLDRAAAPAASPAPASR